MFRSQLLFLCLTSIWPLACTWSFRQPYQNDPLLRIRQPVMGNPTEVIAQPLQMEPAIPTRPPQEWQNRLPEDSTTPTPILQTIAYFDVETGPQPRERISPTEEKTVTIQPVTIDYAHSPDYKQLRGILDRHYHGYWTLRYAHFSQPDPHGGKVRLKDHKALASFQDGDFVEIEGEILTHEPSSGEPVNYPIYGITTIRKGKSGYFSPPKSK